MLLIVTCFLLIFVSIIIFIKQKPTDPSDLTNPISIKLNKYSEGLNSINILFNSILHSKSKPSGGDVNIINNKLKMKTEFKSAYAILLKTMNEDLKDIEKLTEKFRSEIINFSQTENYWEFFDIDFYALATNLESLYLCEMYLKTSDQKLLKNFNNISKRTQKTIEYYKTFDDNKFDKFNNLNITKKNFSEDTKFLNLGGYTMLDDNYSKLVNTNTPSIDKIKSTMNNIKGFIKDVKYCLIDIDINDVINNINHTSESE